MSSQKERGSVRATIERFRGDNRGVIMISSVFFTFLLIGVCWFTFGIGNAITYRETLQNAADAAGYGAAVYDARGMNLLAMMNLIMAAILAVLVLVKMFQAIWIALNITSCIAAAAEIGLNGIADAVCAFTTENEETVNNTVDTVQDAVKTTLTVLHYTETAIAVVWPWVAEGKSVVAAVPFQPKVVTATSFAYSQIPLGLDNLGSTGSISGITSAIKGGGGVSGIASSLGGSIINGGSRLGLPVADESFDEFCDAAIDVAIKGGPDLIGLNNIPVVGPVISWVLDGVEDLVKQFPGFFCGAGSTTTQSDAGKISSKLSGVNSNTGTVQTSGTALQTQCAKAKNQPAPAQGSTATQPTAAQQTAAYNKCMAAGTQTIPSGGLGSTEALVPVTLYSAAKMGTDYFGIWSTAYGEDFIDYASPRVKVGAVESSSPPSDATIPDDATLAVAKAEFYYEPQNTTEKSSDETTIGSDLPFLNCMYNMRWRARLRRYHTFPMPANVGAVMDLISGNYSGALQFAGQVAGGEVNSLLSPSLQKLEGNLPASLQSLLGGVSNPVDGTPAPVPTIIH